MNNEYDRDGVYMHSDARYDIMIVVLSPTL